MRWIPYTEDSPLIEKVEIECPHCGSRQRESASGISTYCRNCGQYFKYAAEPVAAKPSSLWSFGKAKPIPAKTKPKTAPVSLPLTLSGTSAKEGDVLAQSSGRQERSHGHATSQGGTLSRREVLCFDCATVNKAAAKASSTQCSNCGIFIDLRDVEIRERSTQRVRTRGTVTIHKKGALLGTSVFCGNLIIEGTVSCSIYAQGNVEFHNDAKILGGIRCSHLMVERRVQVSAQQAVHLKTLDLQGNLSARVIAAERVGIGRHGDLTGSLVSPLLQLAAGGGLAGVMRIGVGGS